MEGLKVVFPKEMKRIEKLAVEMGLEEEDFMRKAGDEIAKKVLKKFGSKKNFFLLVGKGNNGGDAYAAGLKLLESECKVKAFHLFPLETCDTLNRLYCKRFQEEGGEVTFVTKAEEIVFSKDGVILDGIFGTGFCGALEGLILSAVEKANLSLLPIVAIDIPSGLDGHTGEVKTNAIFAKTTFFLGLPKVGFFLGEGWNFVGELERIDFGLPESLVKETKAEFVLPNVSKIRELLPKIKRNRHKYEAGSVIGIGGYPGMEGAIKLGGLAALKAGAGIVKIVVPKELDLNAPPELVSMRWSLDDLDELLVTLNKSKALFIGPGMGRSKEVSELCLKIFPKIEVPCVIDADALYFFSENLNCALPRISIMTPHKKEVLRFFSQEKNIHQECQEFVEKRNVILVLKGGPTFIFCPRKTALVIPRGDPGMATAGSGDVLTGIIASLLSQGLSPYAASILGVYLHSLAGEIAAKDKTSFCLMASDLIAYLHLAFKKLIRT